MVHAEQPQDLEDPFGSGCAIAASAAPSAPEGDPVELAPVTVTGEKIARPLGETTSSVTVVPAEQVPPVQDRDVHDAPRFTPNGVETSTGGVTRARSDTATLGEVGAPLTASAEAALDLPRGVRLAADASYVGGYHTAIANDDEGDRDVVNTRAERRWRGATRFGFADNLLGEGRFLSHDTAFGEAVIGAPRPLGVGARPES